MTGHRVVRYCRCPEVWGIPTLDDRPLKPLKVALVQMSCLWGDITGNLRKIEEFAVRAADDEAAWILFPELTIQGIFKSPDVFRLSETIDGPSVRHVARLARRLALAIGVGLSECASGKPLNAYILIEPSGEVAGVYRKNRIPKLETPFWQAHDQRPVLFLSGHRVGISICWDNTYPEIPAGYARDGARIVIMPHAWDSDALDEQAQVIDYNSMEEIVEYHERTGRRVWKTYEQMWSEFNPRIPNLARENRIWALFINQAGQPHPSLKFVGPTFAADSQGRIVAETADETEQLVTVAIPGEEAL